MELVIVPWAPGPLIRVEPARAGDDLRRRSGFPIDSSDPDVGALVGAYEAVLAAEPRNETSVTAAHFALLETASLLRSAAPAGPAEREYVRRRTRDMIEFACAGTAEALAYLRDVIADR